MYIDTISVDTTESRQVSRSCSFGKEDSLCEGQRYSVKMSIEVNVRRTVKYPFGFSYHMGSKCPVLGKFSKLYSKLSTIVSA